MKCLVTGAAGFIGSHLCEKLLQEGHDVTGIDCFTDYYSPKIKRNNLHVALEHDAFQFLEANLLEVDLDSHVKGTDYVFHQAAQAGVRASWGTAEADTAENRLLPLP